MTANQCAIFVNLLNILWYESCSTIISAVSQLLQSHCCRTDLREWCQNYVIDTKDYLFIGWIRFSQITSENSECTQLCILKLCSFVWDIEENKSECFLLKHRNRKAGTVHSVSGWTRGVQVKLWNPLRTRAIPERLRGVHDEALYKSTFTFTFKN